MDNEFNITIGERIKAQRQFLKLSREAVNDEGVDISAAFLSEVERGYKGVSAEKLEILCKGLKITPSELLWGRKDIEGIPDYMEDIVNTLKALEPEHIPLVMDILIATVKLIVYIENNRK